MLHEVLQANCENPPDRTGLTNPQGSKRLSLIELANLQRRLHDKAMLKKATPEQIAKCANAWKALEAQRLDTVGQPRPGSYRPDKPSPKQVHSISVQSFDEPTKAIADAQIVASHAPELSSPDSVPPKPDTTSQG